MLCEKVERWLLRIALVVLLAIGLGKLVWLEIDQLIKSSYSVAEQRGIGHVKKQRFGKDQH